MLWFDRNVAGMGLYRERRERTGLVLHGMIDFFGGAGMVTAID
jgi:hypothetical protein